MCVCAYHIQEWTLKAYNWKYVKLPIVHLLCFGIWLPVCTYSRTYTFNADTTGAGVLISEVQGLKCIHDWHFGMEEVLLIQGGFHSIACTNVSCWPA